MRAIIVIPARFGSTRLPGKPLVKISGKSLLQRTWSIAQAVTQVDQVLVASDDDRILQHVQTFGGEAVLTAESCKNGTERVWQAVNSINPQPEIIINLQGDAVLTPPWVIQALLDTLLQDPSIGFATPATQMTVDQYTQMVDSKMHGAVGGTTVVFDNQHNALYFSKRVIPFLRDTTKTHLPLYRHIGLYAYRYPVLQRYLTLNPGPLEQVEGLEQLRALENGMPIKVVPVNYQGRTHWAVDSPEDVLIVERIIAQEGELV